MKTITLALYNSPAGQREVLSCLNAGGVVVFPSDTVYGLLCDATNPHAVSKLLEFKDRPPGKAVSVFMNGLSMIETFCDIPAKKVSLLRELLPGAYTTILPSKHIIDTRLESETGTLGCRWITYEPVNKLVTAFGKPVTATSANLGGHSPHYSAQSFVNDLPKKKEQFIDLVVDAGELPHNKPSTVIDLTTPELKVLRMGDATGKVGEITTSKSAKSTYEFAQTLVEKLVMEAKSDRIVIILKGDLGAGKTQFVKGAASSLGIDDVTSPTFVVYYEYDIPPTGISKGRFTKFYHFDLYNIMNDDEFAHLGIAEILKQKAIICIEWGEKLGDQFELFKENATVMLVTIDHVDTTTRTISVQTL